MSARRNIVGLLAMGVGVLLTGHLYFGRFSVLFPLWPREFVATEWRSAPLNHSFRSTRLRMAGDLIESGALNGLSRAEVLELLGPPNQSLYSQVDLAYYLGPEVSVFSLDAALLVIDLDDDQRVVSARLVQS